MSDDLVWEVLAMPHGRRREAAREAGVSLAGVVVRAKELLADPVAWGRWPVEMRRFADSLAAGHRSRGRVVIHGR